MTETNRVPSHWPNNAKFGRIQWNVYPFWQAASFVQMFSQIIRQTWAVLSVLLKITITVTEIINRYNIKSFKSLFHSSRKKYRAKFLNNHYKLILTWNVIRFIIIIISVRLHHTSVWELFGLNFSNGVVFVLHLCVYCIYRISILMWKSVSMITSDYITNAFLRFWRHLIKLRNLNIGLT